MVEEPRTFVVTPPVGHVTVRYENWGLVIILTNKQTTMKAIICVLLLSILGALAEDCHKPVAPVLPDRFLAVGSFLSLHKDGSLKGYGKFNTKYDWQQKVIRSDSVIFPESNYNISYIVAWNSDDLNLLAFLKNDQSDVQCMKTSNENKLPSPTILKDSCKFLFRDISLDHLVNVWDCDFGEITAMAWTEALDGKITKVKVRYPNADVIMEFHSFIEMDKAFDEDLFVPPKAWNCPSK